MPSGVKFIFDADGNSQTYIDGLISKFDKLSSVSSELVGKLAAVGSIAGIEETIRRTGEYADQLRVVAESIGVTVGELQALNIAGDRANVSQEKMVVLYERLGTAIISTFQGNTKLAQSFKAMGISLDDNKTKAEVFREVLNKIGASPRGSLDAPLENIFGKRNTLAISNLGNQIGAGGVQGFQAAHSDQIVSDSDINGIADTYHQIIIDLKETGKLLLPIGALLLNLVGGIVEMVKGVATAVSDAVKGVPKLFTKPKQTLGHGLGNLGEMGIGILQTGTAPIDWVSKKFGGKGNLTKGLDDYYQPARDMLGLTKKKDYQAAGSALALVAGGGEAKALLGKGATKEAVQAEIKGLIGTQSIEDLSAADRKALDSLLNQRFQLSKRAAGRAGVNAAGGLDAAALNNPDDFGNKGAKPATIKDLKDGVNKLNLSIGTSFGGGAGLNSNLGIGGTLGVDFGTRLVVLNETMVNLLNQIVQNTAGMSPTNKDESNPQDNSMIP